MSERLQDIVQQYRKGSIDLKALPAAIDTCFANWEIDPKFCAEKVAEELNDQFGDNYDLFIRIIFSYIQNNRILLAWTKHTFFLYEKACQGLKEFCTTTDIKNIDVPELVEAMIDSSKNVRKFKEELSLIERSAMFLFSVTTDLLMMTRDHKNWHEVGAHCLFRLLLAEGILHGKKPHEVALDSKGLQTKQRLFLNLYTREIFIR